MKRLISLLMAAVMLVSVFTCCGITSSATDTITNVDITGIPAPLAYDHVWFYSNPQVPDGAKYTATSCVCYDETDKVYLQSSGARGKYTLGHVYTVTVHVEANDGAEFARKDAVTSAVKATVDGKTAKEIKKVEGYQIHAKIDVVYTFKPCGEGLIEKVVATSSDFPPALKAGDNIPNADSFTFTTITGKPAVIGADAQWRFQYDNGGPEYDLNHTIAQKGYKYYLCARVTVDSPGKIDALGVSPQVIINGQKWPIYTSTDYRNSNTTYCVILSPVIDIGYTASFAAGEGSGTMASVGGVRECVLPACTFKAPTGKEFKAWKVGNREYAVGDTIDLNDDTTITALWHAPYKVSFAAGEGSGTMAALEGIKGSYKLPACAFTAPKGKLFKAWEVNGVQNAAGSTITVSSDITLKALWEFKKVTVSFHANGGSGAMPSFEINSGEVFIMPACDFTAPEGKSFKAWSVNNAPENLLYPNVNYSVDDSTQFYAVWKDVHTHEYSILKSDENGHWYACSCGLTQPKLPHEFSSDLDPDCNICNYKRNTGHNHLYELKSDAQYHWLECEACGSVKNVEMHVYDDENDALCNVCNYYRTVSAGHKHVFKLLKTIKPTASEFGYSIFECSCGATYPADFKKPTGKLTLKCKARTAKAQTLTWKKSESADGYQIQISTKDGKKWSTYATIKNSKTTSYTFKNLAAGNAYKFRVRSFADISSFREIDKNQYLYSNWSATLTSPTLPGGTSLTKVTGASKAFTSNWKKNGGVSGYQIQYSLKSDFSGAKLVTIKNVKTIKTTVKKLNAKKVYFVRIRTYKTIAKVNYFSAWSKTVKVKTK